MSESASKITSSEYNKIPYSLSSKHMSKLTCLICRVKSLTNNAKRVGESILTCFTPKGVSTSLQACH